VTGTDIDTDIDGILERYVAVWNNPDPVRRRAEIDALWAEDAYFANARFEYRGHDEIAVGIGRSHDAWVGTGHVFRAAGSAADHHGAAKLVWHMFGPDGGAPVSTGTNFIRFTAGGQIASDHQFVDP
jgi:hypothetical protein